MHDFWSWFLLVILFYLFPLFLGGKRKGKENNQSRGQKSCLSARSIIWYLSLKIRLLIWLCTAGENIIGEPKIQNKFWCTKKMFLKGKVDTSFASYIAVPFSTF